MGQASDTSLLVLLGLRLKGFGAADALAELVGLATDRATAELGDFQERGWALYREGRMTGWSLTPAGRSEGEARLAAELDAAGGRPVVQRCYASFLELNGDMLAVCTDWQMRDPQTLNDHLDAAYDAKIVDRLAAIHDEVSPICDELGGALARLGGYGGRLAGALGRVRAGEIDWFTSVRIPSYHTVWFELHENLLATLGIDRAKEGEQR